VPSVTGDPAIDVAIGLAFFFFLLSIVCSSVNEAIATWLKLRAGTLEAGIRSVLSDDKTKAFYENSRITALFTNTVVPWTSKKKPSYIPSSAFALTLMDTVAPPAEGGTSDDLISRARQAVDRMTRAADPREEKILVILQDALDEAGADRDKFRAAIEKSFNDVMDRVSGWYKRRSQLIMFVIALALAAGINADAYAFGQRLWKNDALRSAVVAQATKATGTSADCGGTQNNGSLETAANCIDSVKQLALPIGWTHASSPHDVPHGVAKAFGLLVTAFAVMLGAPFWFDFLGKVSQLRSSGAKPTTS
jgi:hypothetical protein